MPYTTRPFDTLGPDDPDLGEPPETQPGQIESVPGTITLSRFAGRDDSTSFHGPVGVQDWTGGDQGYTGRDPHDPSTWIHPGDVYEEAPGVFARLHQEGAVSD